MPSLHRFGQCMKVKLVKVSVYITKEEILYIEHERNPLQVSKGTLNNFKALTI